VTTAPGSMLALAPGTCPVPGPGASIETPEGWRVRPYLLWTIGPEGPGIGVRSPAQFPPGLFALDPAYGTNICLVQVFELAFGAARYYSNNAACSQFDYGCTTETPRREGATQNDGGVLREAINCEVQRYQPSLPAACSNRPANNFYPVTRIGVRSGCDAAPRPVAVNGDDGKIDALDHLEDRSIHVFTQHPQEHSPAFRAEVCGCQPTMIAQVDGGTCFPVAVGLHHDDFDSCPLDCLQPKRHEQFRLKDTEATEGSSDSCGDRDPDRDTCNRRDRRSRSAQDCHQGGPATPSFPDRQGESTVTHSSTAPHKDLVLMVGSSRTLLLFGLCDGDAR